MARDLRTEEPALRFATWMCGEGDGAPLQYSCLENPMDGGAWRATVHGVAQSEIRLSDLVHMRHEPPSEDQPEI